MKLLRYLCTVLLLLVTFKASASADNTTLVVELRDGNTAKFLLADKPKITFTAELMSVVSESLSMEFDRSDIKKYRFVKEVSTFVEAIAGSKAVVENNTLIVSGVSNDVVVTIYNSNGMFVKKAAAIDGVCSISLNNLATGSYRVTFDNTLFKFLKK